jgi:hypothetical protein
MLTEPALPGFYFRDEKVKWRIYALNSFPVKKISRFCAPFQLLKKSTEKKQRYGTAK